MMTDNEIIKALECCVYRSCNECIRQPIEYGRTERDCKTGLMKCALSLINRQKAEKEALIAGQETLQKYIAEQKAEIERLKTVNDSFADIGKLYSEIKAEAYKEFAERLKKYEGRRGVPIATIDNLVKEMVGETNA